MSRILIVEDSPTNLEMLEMQLQGEGHEVLVAMDGATGVSIAFYELPDLVLMDMELPLLDGWAATAALKGETVTRNIPVIALTAHAMKAQRTRSMEAGCVAYVNKPIDFDYLKQKIESVLEGAGPRTAPPASVVRAMWLARTREASGGGDDELQRELSSARAAADAARQAEQAANARAQREAEARARAEAEVSALSERTAAAPVAAPTSSRAQTRARRTQLQKQLDAVAAAAAQTAAERAALQADLDAARARLEDLSFFQTLPRDVQALQASLLRTTRQLHRTRSRLLGLQAAVQGALESSLPGWANGDGGAASTGGEASALPVPDLEHLDEALQEEPTTASHSN